MAKIEQILKVLKTERNCLKRQPKCGRRCGECDLVFDDTEMLEVYDFLIEGYETLQDKRATEFTIRIKGDNT